MVFLFCCCCKQTQDEDTAKSDLKKVKYRRKTSFHKAACGNETCTICLEEFEPSEEIKLTPCNHGYHPDCLEHWMRERSNCPMCQAPLKKDTSDENTPLLRSYTIDV